MFVLKTHRFFLSFTLLLSLWVGGCITDQQSGDDPILLRDKKSTVPLSAVRLVYTNSALRGFLPLDVQLTPARVLYNLLETANASDAMTWVVAPADPSLEPQNPLYSGYIEIFPPYTTRGATCRKFTQDLCLHTEVEQIFKTQTTGLACKRYPGSWVIVEEMQVVY